jgi:hypothetical protein
MVEFTATIKKFEAQGEKTVWTYIEVASSIASQLMPVNKKSFRVKGSFDEYIFEGISLLPIGGGDFIIPLNATIRKCIGKSKGALLTVKLNVDESPLLLSEALIECLHDEPAALSFFNKLPRSHQKYL